jgi:hypothetical protein
MTSIPVPVVVAALLWSAALAVTPANAQCSDRPGTPTNVAATAISATQIQVTWTNTASEQVWWDVEITDGAGTILAQPAGVGRGDQGVGLPVSNLYDAPPLSLRCFKVKARTGPHTEGCVSEVWSNAACATTPRPPAAARPVTSVPDRRVVGPKTLGKSRLMATAINDVDIYDGPDGDRFNIIGMLGAGVSAVVIDSFEGWHKLKIDGIPGGAGWVAADHLTLAVRR